MNSNGYNTRIQADDDNGDTLLTATGVTPGCDARSKADHDNDTLSTATGTIPEFKLKRIKARERPMCRFTVHPK